MNLTASVNYPLRLATTYADHNGLPLSDVPGALVHIWSPIGTLYATLTAQPGDDPGEHFATWTPVLPGTYRLEWVATSPLALSEDDDLLVEPRPYFTIATMRSYEPLLADPVKYPDADIDRVRRWFETIWEGFVGKAGQPLPFVPRTYTDTYYTSRPTRAVVLSSQVARQVHAAALNGSLLPEDDVALSPGGVMGYIGSEALSGRFDIWYSAYHTTRLADDVLDAALNTCRNKLLEVRGPLTGREASYETNLGRVTIQTAGVRRPYGIPEYDGLALRYKEYYDLREVH